MLFRSLKGGWISDERYTDAQAFYQGLAVCQKDGYYGMIDRNGNTVVPFVYESLSQASSGLIAAYREADGWTLYAVVTT